MITFEKHFISSLTTILGSKMYFWTRRSVWRYFFASALIGLATPYLLGGFVLTTIGVFIFLVIISLLVIYFSSKSMANKEIFDANVEFSHESIVIKHLNLENQIDFKKWDWVKAIKVNSKLVTLELNERKNKLLIMETSNLDESEIDFFRIKMKELKEKSKRT